MIKLTRAQRHALKQIYDRDPLIIVDHKAISALPFQNPCTYREFRTLAQSGWDCIMIPWCGMWLGIEPDGYTHS